MLAIDSPKTIGSMKDILYSLARHADPLDALDAAPDELLRCLAGRLASLGGSEFSNGQSVAVAVAERTDVGKQNEDECCSVHVESN